MTMPMQRPAARLLAVVALFAFPLAASAQTPSPAQSGTQADARPPFRLGFGDMMVMAVQSRHMKLALAAEQKNWKLAEWVRLELEETFTRLGRLYPVVDKVELAPGLLMVKEPMEALKKAITDENAKDFTAGYERLTQGCNACHTMYKVEEISIKVPKGVQFPDQEFAPPKKSK
jgi:hypothetical protein